MTSVNTGCRYYIHLVIDIQIFLWKNVFQKLSASCRPVHPLSDQKMTSLQCVFNLLLLESYVSDLVEISFTDCLTGSQILMVLCYSRSCAPPLIRVTLAWFVQKHQISFHFRVSAQTDFVRCMLYYSFFNLCTTVRTSCGIHPKNASIHFIYFKQRWWKWLPHKSSAKQHKV